MFNEAHSFTCCMRVVLIDLHMILFRCSETYVSCGYGVSYAKILLKSQQKQNKKTTKMPAVQTCLRALGFPVKKKEVKELLDRFEHDGLELVSFEDFKTILQEKYLNRTFDDLVERAFRIFDIDSSGKIRMKHLKAVTREIGENIPDDELQDMIDMFDRNGDGCVDKSEFKSILQVYDPLEHGEND